MPVWLLNPFAVTGCVLHTTLSPEACRQRLQPRCASWFMARVDASGVHGAVSERGFELRRSPGWGNRNAVQRVAHGRFVAVPGGTAVVVRIALDPGVVVLTLPVLGVVLALWLRDAGHNAAGALPLGAALFAVAFVAALYGIGCWLARGDDAFLLAWLGETLHATAPSAEHAPVLDTSLVN